MSDLPKRLLFSIIAAVVSIVLIFSADYLAVKIIIFFVLGFSVGVCLWEYKFLLHLKDVFLPYGILLIGGMLQLIGFYLKTLSVHFDLAPLLLFFLYVLFLFGLNLIKIEGSLVRIAATLLGVIYIAVPISMVALILYGSSSATYLHYEGKIWLFYVVVVVKSQDIFAYFGGKLFGRHKIAPRISPKKTWEGTIIGILASGGISVLFAYICQQWGCNFFYAWYWALFLGILLALIGQFGDAIESLFKRDAKIKDSNIIPGIGGLLDLFDSMILAFPVIYFIKMYL